MAFKTRQQIAQELGISRWTLKRWLDDHRIHLKNRLISPTEAAEIFTRFGVISATQKPLRSDKGMERQHN